MAVASAVSGVSTPIMQSNANAIVSASVVIESKSDALEVSGANCVTFSLVKAITFSPVFCITKFPFVTFVAIS